MAKLIEHIGLPEEAITPAVTILISGGDLALISKYEDQFLINEGFKSIQKRISLNKIPKNEKVSIFIYDLLEILRGDEIY